VLYGLGAGAGVARQMLIIQTVFDKKDVAMGIAIVSQSHMLWHPLLRSRKLSLIVDLVRGQFPDLNLDAILGAGAKDLAGCFTPEHTGPSSSFVQRLCRSGILYCWGFELPSSPMQHSYSVEFNEKASIVPCLCLFQLSIVYITSYRQNWIH
jgi:hypothetical protein